MQTLNARFHLIVRFALLLALCVAGIAADWTTASAEIPQNGQLLISSEMLKEKTEQVTKATGLDEGTKAKLLSLYRKILENLALAASHDILADKFVQSIETAPVKIKNLREAMVHLVRQAQSLEKDNRDAGNASSKEIEQQLLKAKASYTVLEAEVASLTRQATALTERPVKASQRLAEIKEREQELLAAVQTPSPAPVSPQVAEAESWQQQTQLQALHSESRMLNQELVSMPVLVELANVQQEEAAARLEAARSLLQSLEAEVNRQRQEEATQSIGEAKEAVLQVAGSQPVLQLAAAKNAQLGGTLQTVTLALEAITAEKERLEKEQKRVEENFRSTKQKIALAGLSQALGFILHEQRQNLPNVRLLQKKMAENQKVIIETGLLQVQSSEERKKLDDLEGAIAELVSGSSLDEFKHIEPELRKLLTNRRDLLDKIFTANQLYLGTLSEIEVLYNQLLKTVVSFESFLAEHLLWIRSIPWLSLKDFKSLPQEAIALFAPDQWLAVGKALAVQANSSPILILACLLTAALIGCKKRMRILLDAIIEQAVHPATYRFALPMHAFGLIVLLSLSWPLLIMTLGWQMHIAAESTAFAAAVAMSLVTLSYRFFLLRVFRTLLLPNGLADRFFHWPKETITLLRRETGWLMATFLPAVFLIQLAFFANFSADGSHVLGRLFFIAALGLITVFFFRTLHPRTGVWHRFLEKYAHRLLVRIYPLFFFLIILLPLVLSGLILAGYVFAVGSLLRCLINSLWVALGIVICHQLVERWLIQSSRQLFRKKALLLHAQAKVNREPAQAASDKAPGPKEEPVEDLIELSTDSRKLLHTTAVLTFGAGLWLVWADVLPALRLFNEFTLWSYTVTVSGQASVVPVTLADVGLVILIGIITLTATRHFPALLKIVLLQHLDMPPGSRYTITTLSRYLIGGMGLMAIADILGFSWSQIQWLVAALGVGIGFGLQEIVANFISGLIILFERPIRVGDVVTVGGTDGRVTRIRIRATTIRDFDGKELLVPNKEFISGHLLNWSLSDPVIRILLPVGVAYGSDVQQAMRLMREAAEENPLVLEDPPTTVTFDSFGDNALLLTLRCFIGSVDDRVAIKSVLHQVIDQKFREAEISMAFPQRDVHLDMSKPLAIKVIREENTVVDKSPSALQR